MSKLLDRVCLFLAVVAGLLLLFVTFSIAYSIFTRQLGLPTPVWVVQINEYTLLWITFLGTAWVLSKNKHVSIHIFMERLSPRGRKILDVIHSFMGLCLCGAFFWYGLFTTWEHYHRRVIDVQSIDVPKAYILVVIPIGFGLLALQFFRKFVVGLSSLKTVGADANNDDIPQREGH